MSLYRIGRALFRTFFSLFMRVRVVGRENIPETGPVLLCSNHISNLDPTLLGSFMSRSMTFMAKEELFEKKLVNAVLTRVGAFPVKRGSSDRRALKKGLGLLEEGHVLCLFPEGTRSRTGEIRSGLAGSGFFALRSKAAVVPVVIVGSYKLFGRITIIYGPPVDMDSMREKKADAAEATETIMEQIRGLKKEHMEKSG
ncbi:lysophospholipid acyltransferase family protein [Salibacterium qingdaonense]|uniref:1-acyl-sn-glycerol-3-phosphate acyltransferase n=1 Tax=Salibacterium qingdaonense TaxID=266892 RepID=A0A1I4M4Z7_9BACI|nr:lysophospholipid acyltransferase family protein [Salibacterium qingdaonense]SFL98289.1 1-acyl-sn-glycerol-3-phosphate acyltransferase [Salibacterium qingdaonense]